MDALATYAGRRLGWPAAATRDWLASFDLARTLGAFTPAGVGRAGTDHLPGPAPAPEPPPRLNVLRWPAGACRPATYHTLVADPEVLAAVRALTAPAELTLSDGRGVVTAAKMRPLPPRPVAPALWLVTLVDARWHWWDRTGPATGATTWAGLLIAWFTRLGLTVAVPTVAAGYGTPDPARWDLAHQPLPVLIDAACRAVGLAVVARLDGAVELVPAATCRNREDAAISAGLAGVVAGGVAPAGDLAAALPRDVTVVFPGDPPAAETRPTGGTGVGVAGAAGRVWAELPATASASARAAYADLAAPAWVRLRSGRVDATLSGVVAWAFTGLEDAVEWAWQPGEGGRPGRVTTRVLRPPWGDGNQYSHPLPAAAGAGPAADTDLTLHVDTWDEDTHSGTAQVAAYGFLPAPDDLTLGWLPPRPSTETGVYGRVPGIDLHGNDLTPGTRYRAFRVGQFTDKDGVPRFDGRVLYCAYMGVIDFECSPSGAKVVF